jgi:hypothetical protein
MTKNNEKGISKDFPYKGYHSSRYLFLASGILSTVKIRYNKRKEIPKKKFKFSLLDKIFEYFKDNTPNRKKPNQGKIGNQPSKKILFIGLDSSTN